MDIETVTCLYFSPTGTTGTTAKEIARGMAGAQVKVLDCTRPAQRAKNTRAFRGDEIVILAVPVYYGRVPETAADYFYTLSGENTPAVLVVIYGNRAYDDALRELYDIASKRGFIPVAGGAFIGEHSYSTEKRPIARGRPDEKDLQKAREFGGLVRKKMEALDLLGAIKPLTVPGNVPYKEPEALYRVRSLRQTASFTPETDMALCTGCTLCADACPVEAIDRDDPATTDKGRCTLCFACVKVCPVQARAMNELSSGPAVTRIYESCQSRKEPEYYLPGP
ncbi:MAG TPA: EFR1 family ferrodoxin [Syntrophorhabdaceae bacterium]|jgi:ferredoxin